jgi:hypothetical protein
MLFHQFGENFVLLCELLFEFVGSSLQFGEACVSIGVTGIGIVINVFLLPTPEDRGVKAEQVT